MGEGSEDVSMSRLPIRYLAVFLLLFAVTSLAYTVPTAGDDSLTVILNGILKRYGDLPGLTVTYQREIITKSAAILGDDMKTDLATGSFIFKSPYYLKVIQDLPREEIIITDGQIIWWYIPDNKVVYRYSTDKLGKELQLLSDIFKGLSKATESFDIHYEESTDKREYRLTLIPKEPWEEIDHISLSVGRDGFNIMVVEIHNLFGSITRFRLGSLSVRKNFEKGFFEFIVPEGVQIQEEE
jgi:outer membrane lipoprotein-sorting protein